MVLTEKRYRRGIVDKKEGETGKKREGGGDSERGAGVEIRKGGGGEGAEGVGGWEKDRGGKAVGEKEKEGN